jgi:hypothetical protein
MSLFVVASAIFIWHFINTADELAPQNGIPHFVSSIKVLIPTYVIPLVLMWAIGFAACINVANYSFFTKGAIYKNLFKNLYKGITLVYIGTFLTQLLILSNLNLNKFSFYLVLVYGLLILGVAGFLMIYKGSQSLNKLEKI